MTEEENIPTDKEIEAIPTDEENEIVPTDKENEDLSTDEENEIIPTDEEIENILSQGECEPEPPVQPNNPLHGVSLKIMLINLEEYYGWEGLAERIEIRCFAHDPSMKSSLKFLRKTPWAREKVEELYDYTFL